MVEDKKTPTGEIIEEINNLYEEYYGAEGIVMSYIDAKYPDSDYSSMLDGSKDSRLLSGLAADFDAGDKLTSDVSVNFYDKLKFLVEVNRQLNGKGGSYNKDFQNWLKNSEYSDDYSNDVLLQETLDKVSTITSNWAKMWNSLSDVDESANNSVLTNGQVVETLSEFVNGLEKDLGKDGEPFVEAAIQKMMDVFPNFKKTLNTYINFVLNPSVTDEEYQAWLEKYGLDEGDLEDIINTFWDPKKAREVKVDEGLRDEDFEGKPDEYSEDDDSEDDDFEDDDPEDEISEEEKIFQKLYGEGLKDEVFRNSFDINSNNSETTESTEDGSENSNNSETTESTEDGSEDDSYIRLTDDMGIYLTQRLLGKQAQKEGLGTSWMDYSLNHRRTANEKAKEAVAKRKGYTDLQNIGTYKKTYEDYMKEYAPQMKLVDSLIDYQTKQAKNSDAATNHTAFQNFRDSVEKNSPDDHILNYLKANPELCRDAVVSIAKNNGGGDVWGIFKDNEKTTSNAGGNEIDTNQTRKNNAILKNIGSSRSADDDSDDDDWSGYTTTLTSKDRYKQRKNNGDKQETNNNGRGGSNPSISSLNPHQTRLLYETHKQQRNMKKSDSNNEQEINTNNNNNGRGGRN